MVLTLAYWPPVHDGGVGSDGRCVHIQGCGDLKRTDGFRREFTVILLRVGSTHGTGVRCEVECVLGWVLANAAVAIIFFISLDPSRKVAFLQGLAPQ